MTPRILGLAAAAMLAGAPALAQPTTGTTTAPTTRSAPADHGTTTTTPGTSVVPPGARNTVVPPGAPGNRSDQQAASGDSNQAIATTTANATQPAHGANSFTSGQAKSRMEDHGFSNVTNLKKDDNGVWRADAQKDGHPVQAWLDYKGNVGADNGMSGSSASTSGASTTGTNTTGTSTTGTSSTGMAR